jgi:oligoendopeptidase F
MTLFETLPRDYAAFIAWEWAQIEPFYDELADRPLNAASVSAWLADWTRLQNLINECHSRLFVATTLDTTDSAAETRFHHYLEQVEERAEMAEQRLREKLLASKLEPDNFDIALRDLRSDAALFREVNIPLFTQEEKLANEFNQVIGAQTVEWEGEERTIPQMRPLYLRHDRAERERAWRLASEQQLADREPLNDLWRQFLALRLRIAANADCATYRDFRWKAMKRFDYTPQDCLDFGDAIEQVVVPAAERIYERRRARLGVETLRPWDLDVDPFGRPALKPFSAVEDLERKCEAIFRRVDPRLGEYFSTMRHEGLLDLDNRKGKAPGGYQIDFRTVKRPFIFMNAVGLHDDVQTLLHEGGHAFHCFESARLPYAQHLEFGSEIAEVASMSMELLAAPYLGEHEGGFYSTADAARARVQHLESLVLFWPYMAVVDGFQHWVYTHADAAADPAQCDAAWGALWDRFMRGVDWSGMDDLRLTGWQRKVHIFDSPFYYVDYGLAQVGALQIWRNALHDQAAAVQQYRRGLSLGGTRTLPELFAATGASFATDATTLAELVALIEETIDGLETA